MRSKPLRPQVGNEPPGGGETPANHLSTLQSLAHQLFTADEIGELLETVAPETANLPCDSDDARLVQASQRDCNKMRRVPEPFVAEQDRDQ